VRVGEPVVEEVLERVDVTFDQAVPSTGLQRPDDIVEAIGLLRFHVCNHVDNLS
jgi:hypothetical protein